MLVGLSPSGTAFGDVFKPVEMGLAIERSAGGRTAKPVEMRGPSKLVAIIRFFLFVESVSFKCSSPIGGLGVVSTDVGTKSEGTDCIVEALPSNPLQSILCGDLIDFST